MSKLFPTTSFAKGSSIYEVNIRQYTAEGTLAAFQQHLPRLKEMGVDILWLMPITPISIKERQGTLGSYYACSSYIEINPEFGILDDLQALVDDAHSKEMKVIIDWVANHTGWDHPWTKERPDWYMKDENGSFTEMNGWKDVIDLDYTNIELRQEMIRCMQYWINECNIDGFRCDMAHLIPLDFWVEARSACDELKPLFWLAETDNLEYHDVFDATYAWTWMHVSEKFIKGQASMEEFKNALLISEQLPKDCFKLLFTTNHDENSWNGTEYEKYGAAAKALAVLTCTFKGMPLVYSGQELPNHKRLKFFDKDEIEWTDNIQLHSFYQTLLQARKTSKAIAEGSVEILPTNADEPVLAFVREFKEEVVLVVLNLSDHEKLKADIHHSLLKGKFKNLFSGLQFQFDKKINFELNPWEYHVYVKD
jgi:glycosidase